MRGRIIICCLLFSLNAAAQEQTEQREQSQASLQTAESRRMSTARQPTDSVITQESKPDLMERLHEVQQYLDTKAKAAVDARYIEVPPACHLA